MGCSPQSRFALLESNFLGSENLKSHFLISSRNIDLKDANGLNVICGFEDDMHLRRVEPTNVAMTDPNLPSGQVHSELGRDGRMWLCSDALAGSQACKILLLSFPEAH